MSTLIVRDLTRSFGGKVAVSDVSFTAEAGQMTALLGPNGAGKTTTMRCVVGLLSPDRGSSVINGLPIEDKATRRFVGYVPEEPALFRQLSVWEHMVFVAKLYDVADWRARAEDLLESFDLTATRDDLGLLLSQGQRRKLVLSMSILHDCDLFVLDEPFNGLDFESQHELRKRLTQLRDGGKSLLVSTHRLAEAENMADKFVVLREGRVAFDGDHDTLARRFPSAASLEEAYLGTKS